MQLDNADLTKVTSHGGTTIDFITGTVTEVLRLEDWNARQQRLVTVTGAGGGGGGGASSAPASPAAATLDDLLVELRAIRALLERQARITDRWDSDGLPSLR